MYSIKLKLTPKEAQEARDRMRLEYAQSFKKVVGAEKQKQLLSKTPETPAKGAKPAEEVLTPILDEDGNLVAQPSAKEKAAEAEDLEKKTRKGMLCELSMYCAYLCEFYFR